MVFKVQVQTFIPKAFADAIQLGIPNKWKSPYHFLQLAAEEKLLNEGLISNDTLTFIHYHCQYCNRDLYVLPDVAKSYEYIWCIKCGKSDKKDAMICGNIVLGKNLPQDAEIKRW